MAFTTLTIKHLNTDKPTGYFEAYAKYKRLQCSDGVRIIPKNINSICINMRSLKS